MKTNRSGVELIKKFEGCRLTAYKDPVGIWTIGYGHTSMAGEPIVTKGMKITAQQAVDILVKDLGKYERAVMDALKRGPTENQFAAMVSLCFNIGPGAFTKSSVVKWYNAGDMNRAAAAFNLWNKAGGKVLPGLITRRKAEDMLFRTPPEPMQTVPAPKAPVQPETPQPPSLTLSAPPRPWWKAWLGI